MNLSLFPPFFHDLSFSKSNKRSGVKRQKNSTKVCGLIFHQCFSYSSSSNCLLWIMSQKLVQMSKKNWRREPSSRLYLGFLESFELFYGCFQSRDQQQPVVEDLVISWPFSVVRWEIFGLLTFLFFSDLPPLDLLSFVLERDTSKLVPGVHIKQAGGVRGIHFSSPHTAMSFPSSQLLVNCDLFPQEFSIVVTLKVSSGAAKVSVLETNHIECQRWKQCLDSSLK